MVAGKFEISPAIENDYGVFVSKTEFGYGDLDCLGYIPIQTLLDIEHGHTDMDECDDENFFLAKCRHYYWREIQILRAQSFTLLKADLC